MTVKGAMIVGGGHDRVEHDYYATPFDATRAILEREPLSGSILEPSAGEGHIVKVLREFYPLADIEAVDLVRRRDLFGLPIRGGVDFLRTEFPPFDNVVMNPPFRYITEFVERALTIARKKVLCFGKIQLLEGARRRELFETSPLRCVYVFSRRVKMILNGTEAFGSTTMCFAWYVWDKEYSGPPRLAWI